MKTTIRRHRLLLASLALGVSAMILSYAALSPYMKSCPVVVACRDVDAYAVISAGDLSILQLPVKAVPSACFDRPGDVVGSFARSKIVAGQMIMPGHIAPSAAIAGLSYDLPAGSRAFFLPLPEGRALGGILREGEKVDVICAAKAASTWASSGEAAAFTALKDLTVVKVVREQATGEFLGVVVYAAPSECETIARYLESASLYLSLAPRLVAAAGVHPEVWPSR